MRLIMLLSVALPPIAALPLGEAVSKQNITYSAPSKGEVDRLKWNGPSQEMGSSEWHNLPHKKAVKNGWKPSPGSSVDAQPVELVPVPLSNRTNIPAVEVETAPPTKAPPPPKPTPPTSQPGAGSQPPTDNFGDYKQTMLEQHNIHRHNHSASDLAWDNTLAQYAEKTAKSCIFQHDMKQGGGGYGQNLAFWYNSEMANWQFYGQDKPPSSSSGGLAHFTQLVWKDTTKVGCATVKCAAGTVSPFDSWYTVCNYNPQGNIGDKYGSNVLNPLGEKMVTV
ncbi:cysteine-rich secretory protein family domain-containing protein [Hirsutella rhossiliensis]|uniref:Cysteine-rich secretory protein family domain-containing protein n=1 Tax=Hirsutella rhossiliensis TaxID=111463 RepID=A0A9P8MQE7_9HYPO|nr:cysteine-rich secretory protein family domain-containing protein [Hirsutella rhossiliensis]KAH0959858.1 cysteine-rich secretory protein family domain-containing protein [Hirsutella rhossiliensis]